MSRKTMRNRQARYNRHLLHQAITESLKQLPTTLQMAGAFRLNDCKTEAELLLVKRWAEERAAEHTGVVLSHLDKRDSNLRTSTKKFIKDVTS